MDPSSPNTQRLLTQLLAILRAAHWSHWTTHWQVRGVPQYGDHLLFERLYTGISDEIDGLAEKCVSYFGPQSVDALDSVANAARVISAYYGMAGADPIKRALVLEQQIQNALALTYTRIKDSGEMSLGLDDFLMATANSHETNTYLLRQRLRGTETASLPKLAAAGDPYWMTAKFPGKDSKGRPVRKGDKVFYYPRTKTMLTGEEAEKASREFDAAVFDEGY
jgi:DNA-binding ferritin-like protein